MKIDTPAELVTAHPRVAEGWVQSVYFHDVPSFVLALDEVVEVPRLGKVHYDIAFGGAFYAYVLAEEVGVTCAPEDYPTLIEKGTAIKRTIMTSRTITHPFEEDLSFLYGTIFVGPPVAEGVHSRSVCIFADGEVKILRGCNQRSICTAVFINPCQ